MNWVTPEQIDVMAALVRRLAQCEYPSLERSEFARRKAHDNGDIHMFSSELSVHFSWRTALQTALTQNEIRKRVQTRHVQCEEQQYKHHSIHDGSHRSTRGTEFHRPCIGIQHT